jgi:predicted dehydrogenase
VEKTLGVGIVGLGWVAHQYIRAFTQHPHTHLTALCTRDRARGRRIVDEYELTDCSVYTGLDGLLDDDDVQVVCILTPNFVHLEQALRVLRAEKHILLEKPIGLNWSEVCELERELRVHDVRTIVGFVLRWNSLFRNIDAVVTSGTIGSVLHAEIDFMLPMDDSLACYEWCAKVALGGSVLMQSGCHAVDALRFFHPVPVRQVSAVSARHRHDFDHDTTYALSLEFENGSTGRVFCTYDTAHPYTFGIRLYGTEGTVLNDRLWAPTRFPGQTDWIRMPSVMPDTADVAHHPFPELIRHFVECILSGEDATPNIRETVHNFEIIEAAERSARMDGAPVFLPLQQA